MDKNPINKPTAEFVNGYGMKQFNPKCPKCGHGLKLISNPPKKPKRYIAGSSTELADTRMKPKFHCTNPKCQHQTFQPITTLSKGEVENRKKAIARSARELAITTYQKLIADHQEVDDAIRTKCLKRANTIAISYYNTQLEVFCNGLW
jgi:hypothetical protein